MNFIFISPHSPRNYWLFCDRLKKNGVTVLGIGDIPYDSLEKHVKDSLTEYYYVESLQDYDKMFRAVAFLSFKYGKIDWIESHNELFIEQDARLREDFNIKTGLQTADIERFRLKSAMKPYFRNAHIAAPRHAAIPTIREAKAFARKVGYPVIVKPDMGVGAKDVQLIETATELEWFFWEKSTVPYIMEEFVHGNIYSYDAIVNLDGEPLFESMTAWPPSIMEIVAKQLDFSYYVAAEIPDDLRNAGRAAIRTFGIRGRFIHLEFFRLTEDQPPLGAEGELVALEINLRPPRGYAVDMMNYAHSTDAYKIWADMVTINKCIIPRRSDHRFCVFAGRRSSHAYLHSHAEIITRYKSNIVLQETIPPQLHAQMGNYMYSARTRTKEEAAEFIRYVQTQFSENGQARRLLLKDLKPGMVLVQPIVLLDGKILMETGTRMTEFVISLLRDPNYMEKVLPEGSSLDDMMLTVNVPQEIKTVSVEDHPKAEMTDSPYAKLPPPDPRTDKLLDADYVRTYQEVFQELEQLLNPNTIHRGLNLDALGQLISDRKLASLCNDSMAITQIHNMDCEGSYLIHHSLHVAILAGLTGKWMRWPRESYERLLLAGLLHDVGKLKIAKDILNKPGKLSLSEMKIMQNHPTYGVEILAKSGLSTESDLIAGVLQHHERGDGSGYPSGLKNDMISPFGKILAILDIYDAMATNRVYAHKVSPFDIFDRLSMDMIAGKLDEAYCVLFMREMGRSLTGNWVRLSSGEKAKIIYIDQNKTNALPIVQTTEGKFYDLTTDDSKKVEELLTIKEATLGK